MAIGIAAHVGVGEPQHDVAVAFLELGEASGEVLPHGRRVERQDGADQRVAVAQTTRILCGSGLLDQRVDQAVVDVVDLGRVGAQRAVRAGRAVGGVVVERGLERGGLVDVGFDRIGVGVDGAVEDHRADLVRVVLGVLGADAGAVRVTQVGQLVVAERGPDGIQILGDVGGSDVLQEVLAHLVDAALHERLRLGFDVCDTGRRVVDLWVGALPVIVGIGVAPHRGLGGPDAAGVEADEVEALPHRVGNVVEQRHCRADARLPRTAGVDHQGTDLVAGRLDPQQRQLRDVAVGLAVVDGHRQHRALGPLGNARLRVRGRGLARRPLQGRARLRHRADGASVDHRAAARREHQDHCQSRCAGETPPSEVHGRPWCHVPRSDLMRALPRAVIRWRQQPARPTRWRIRRPWPTGPEPAPGTRSGRRRACR